MPILCLSDNSVRSLAKASKSTSTSSSLFATASLAVLTFAPQSVGFGQSLTGLHPQRLRIVTIPWKGWQGILDVPALISDISPIVLKRTAAQ